MASMPNDHPLSRNHVTLQASLAKVLFLAEVRIRPGFPLESNAGVRRNLRKGEQLYNQV